jgi:hypothetical protein
MSFFPEASNQIHSTFDLSNYILRLKLIAKSFNKKNTNLSIVYHVAFNYRLNLINYFTAVKKRKNRKISQAVR